MWLPRWNNLELPFVVKENNSRKFNYQPPTQVTATSATETMAHGLGPAQEQGSPGPA